MSCRLSFFFTQVLVSYLSDLSLPLPTFIHIFLLTPCFCKDYFLWYFLTMIGMHCASLEDPKALMRMGLSVILIGHVNFLLGALVHGAVLRHINLHKQARAMEYSISNVMALSAGLVVSLPDEPCVFSHVPALFDSAVLGGGSVMIYNVIPVYRIAISVHLLPMTG